MEEKIIVSLKNLLAATSEVAIAREVAIYHDIARISYPFQPNKVESFEDFTKMITNYYSHHTSLCGERGKHHLSPCELSTQAIQILEEEYRNHGEDIFVSYKDARDDTNGGLMIILDIIAERLKADSVEQYIQNVFQKSVSSIPPEAKVEVVCRFIGLHSNNLESLIFIDQPERYADNYNELIKAYVKSLQKRSGIFRVLPTQGKTLSGREIE